MAGRKHTATYGSEVDAMKCKRPLVLEDEHGKLVLDGVPTSRPANGLASDAGPATGSEPRAGGIPPTRAAENARLDCYLSLMDRQRIATLLERDHGVRE